MLSRHFVVLIGLLCVSLCLSDCQKKGFNKVPRDLVLSRFDAFIESDFVGQEKATRKVRKQLSAYLDFGEPVVLHFIGPEGTGKSHLAEIVAKSLFYPVDYESVHVINTIVAAIGALAWPYLEWCLAAFGWDLDAVLQKLAICWDVKDVHWQSACGVSSYDFARELSDPIPPLESYFERATLEVSFQPSTVLILDEIEIFDKVHISQYFKRFLEKKVIRSKEGLQVSLQDSVIIFTSNLEKHGLDIQLGTNYNKALEKVLNAANSRWGKHSMMMLIPDVIPFTLLTDQELMKVAEKELTRFEKKIKSRVKVAIDKKDSKSTNSYRWSGTVYHDIDLSRKIVEEITKDILPNARTMTHKLRQQLKDLVVRVKDIVLDMDVMRDKDGVMVFYQSLQLVVRPNHKPQWLVLELVE